MRQITTMKLARWAETGEHAAEEMCFMLDAPGMPESLAGMHVAMAEGDESRADELLARGAAGVLLGDLALLDSTAIERLVQKHGGERIGIWVRAAKRHVTWTLDRNMYSSNADFNCLTPSLCAPGWEALKTDGTGCGSSVEWWLEQMLGLGASTALISMDMQDDDLNICAGLIEQHGTKLWFSTREQPETDLEPWVRWGQVRQLVLPAVNNRDEAEMARICAPAMIMVAEADADSASESNTGKQLHAEAVVGNEGAVQV